VVDGPDDVRAMEQLSDHVVGVVLAAGIDPALVQRATRRFYATSSCGICGKASIDRVRLSVPPRPEVSLPPIELLRSLPDRMRAAQATFAATGGLHGAALFDFEGKLEVTREDVGRHNAVDKVVGWRLRADRVPVNDRLLVVSSRASFEIVQKAAMAGIPAVVAVGASSSLAVSLAQETGLALFGWAGAERLTRYA
jgi:FdhD protein